MTAFFTPPTGIAPIVCAAITAAKTWVEMLAYEFTSETIAQALVKAQHRGVRVVVTIDANILRAGSAALNVLKANGVPLLSTRSTRSCTRKS